MSPVHKPSVMYAAGSGRRLVQVIELNSQCSGLWFFIGDGVHVLPRKLKEYNNNTDNDVYIGLEETNDFTLNELNSQLSGWLAKCEQVNVPVRALIAPHAGYYYCGACGAHAYKQIDPTRIKRIFILGPSHHVRLSGCALTATEKYRTPFYDLIVDDKVNSELNGAGPFELMSIDTDEDEHSIEMQLPYIAKAMESRKGNFTIVPILVGSLTPEKEQLYGQIFSRYLADPENFFVISSDFCHWGQRFNYTFYDKSCGEIWKSIENLDKMGMEKIEKLDSRGFTEYLKQYQNTICGRYPVGVLLHTIDAMRKVSNGYRLSFRFLNYSQSSKCSSMRDSSVSYAAGVLMMD